MCPRRSRTRIGLIALSLLPALAGCQRESTTSRAGAEEVPELVASGGQRVPPGFVTRFTAPDGASIELAYSQVSAELLADGKLAIRLSAESGAAPARALRVALDVTSRKPARLEELAGAWLTALPPAANGFVYQPRAGDPASQRRASSASVSITTVDRDAVEGTFFADLGAGDYIADGAFRAARSPNLEPEPLAALAGRAR